MEQIKEIAVIGTGQMGMGLVECAALSGFRVSCVKGSPGPVHKSFDAFVSRLNKLAAKGKIDDDKFNEMILNVTFYESCELDILKTADLVIETVIEDENTKLDLLPRLEVAMRGDAVLATNTSSLDLKVLAGCLIRPERFIGLHFFNPVPVMKLVELSVFKNTPPEVTAAVRGACEQLGKTVVSVQESPGYVVNRLLMPYLLHAIDTLEHGVASASSIDAAMKLGCGHPMGPLALADFVGLDVVLAIAQSLKEELNDSRFRVPSLLRKLVSDGELGRKTGKGVYDYTGSTVVPNPNARIMS